MTETYEGRQFDFEKVCSGEIALGPGTMATLFPLVLPYDCCRHLAEQSRGHVGALAHRRQCAVCQTWGWTHSAAPDADLRCLDHADFLQERAKTRLREADY